ncbi:nitrate regulatory gene2 protein-like [Tasmannia lanceolata]|uniref:nitrate regulatory gene2 protein-like n=1 Tax=Tasmannia lanceolata TaxID=3420 RepID=UPI0040633A3C
MGCSNSKYEKSEVLRLCKERKRFIKQAIDSRYALASAHLSYVQSLRSIGIALRRFAEAEVLIESSLSPTELDKTPSHSSYPSPSHSNNAEIVDSPINNGSPSSPTMSYMKSGASASLTFRLNSSSINQFVEDESMDFTTPLPPPPPPPGSSWDFFDPIGVENGYKQNFDNLTDFRQFREEGVDHFIGEEMGNWEKFGLVGKDETFIGEIRRDFERAHESTNGITLDKFSDLEQARVGEEKRIQSDDIASGSVEALPRNLSSEPGGSKREEKRGLEKEVHAEREDPSEFITHRAKDFLSSMKDIEHRFFRASESGKEVSRMLEANKIQLHCSESKGTPSASLFLAACHLVCCRRGIEPVPHEPPQHVTKVITWKRSTSSQSSSSRNPLASASRDDVDDSGSDFAEEFCMISGRHSSTLDRLYAWERKLYDEVKASESIRKEYDRRCNLLRHQFARDLNPQVIDKTRAIVKDLHSQIKVAIHAVDSISKRIERLRDEELQPQLVELIKGLIRMWKTMLECHHTQYITISLAYHTRSSSTLSQSESHRQAVAHLQNEIECFGSSFSDWIKAQNSYVDALNSWLQNCIIPSQDRSKRRMAFSPRRALAPPIFVLCHDWFGAIKALPSLELSDAIKGFITELHDSFGQQVEEQNKKEIAKNLENKRELETKEDEKCEKVSNLSSLQASLTRAFDRLTKFAEASLKMYEDIRQASEKARADYANARTRS